MNVVKIEKVGSIVWYGRYSCLDEPYRLSLFESGAINGVDSGTNETSFTKSSEAIEKSHDARHKDNNWQNESRFLIRLS